MGAIGTEIVQPPQVGLQLPTGQLCLLQQGQVAEDEGIQGGGAAAEKSGMEKGRDGVRGRVGPGKIGSGQRGTTGGEEDTQLWSWGGESAPGGASLALNGTLSQGCIKGTLSAPQLSRPVPGLAALPPSCTTEAAPAPHTALPSPDPMSVPSASCPELEPPP